MFFFHFGACIWAMDNAFSSSVQSFDVTNKTRRLHYIYHRSSVLITIEGERRILAVQSDAPRKASFSFYFSELLWDWKVTSQFIPTKRHWGFKESLCQVLPGRFLHNLIILPALNGSQIYNQGINGCGFSLNDQSREIRVSVTFHWVSTPHLKQNAP